MSKPRSLARRSTSTTWLAPPSAASATRPQVVAVSSGLEAAAFAARGGVGVTSTAASRKQQAHVLGERLARERELVRERGGRDGDARRPRERPCLRFRLRERGTRAEADGQDDRAGERSDSRL